MLAKLATPIRHEAQRALAALACHRGRNVRDHLIDAGQRRGDPPRGLEAEAAKPIAAGFALTRSNGYQPPLDTMIREHRTTGADPPVINCELIVKIHAGCGIGALDEQSIIEAAGTIAGGSGTRRCQNTGCNTDHRPHHAPGTVRLSRAPQYRLSRSSDNCCISPNHPAKYSRAETRHGDLPLHPNRCARQISPACWRWRARPRSSPGCVDAAAVSRRRSPIYCGEGSARQDSDAVGSDRCYTLVGDHVGHRAGSHEALHLGTRH